MNDQSEPGNADISQTTGINRLLIGALQGTIAWLLLELVPPVTYDLEISSHPKALLWWPQNHPIAFAILALLTAFLPVIALAEIGRMQRRNLAVYLAAATVILAALVGYNLWREPVVNGWGDSTLRIWPSASFVFCAGLGVFIVNQLMEHSERGHRLFTEYAAHFEDGWMRGFQFVISLVFTLLVWGVLELGKGLFDLIQLDWFGHMITHNWFRCPVLAIAFAASVHITDVRPALLRGMRNLGLTLLSWLLPLVVALGCAFLVALLFTGLRPLWNTRFAASILLWSVTVTLILLNAAYKDGDPANLPVLPIRWAGRVAGPMMLILAMLATYAIALRVRQHGWTPERVQSCAVASVALIYSGGYTWASLAPGPWLKRLEKVNVAASLVIVGILVLLFTPVADPARLAVDSQVGRLDRGAIAPAKFDYSFLRFEAGRFGTDALAVLVTSTNAEVASRARVAQASIRKTFTGSSAPESVVTEPALSHVTVYPLGATLPPDFAPKNLDDSGVYGLSCLRNGSPCDIIIWKRAAQLSPLLIIRAHRKPDRGDASELYIETEGENFIESAVPVYGRGPNGKWRRIGMLDHLNCPGVLDELRKREGKSVRPAHDDIQVGGITLTFTPESNPACPTQLPVRPTPTPKVLNDAAAPGHMGPAFGNPGAM